MALFSYFLRDQRGATAIEYALVAAMIAIVIAGSIKTVGTKTTNNFGVAANKL